MITTTFILADSQPMRQLFELQLEAVPAPGEHIAFGGRVYQALERSWRFDPKTPPLDTGAVGPVELETKVGILLRQIGGPAHVVSAGAGLVS